MLNLRNFNFRIILQAFSNVQMIGLVVLLFCIIFMGGYDTIYKSSITKLSTLDTDLTNQKKTLTEKQQLLTELTNLRKSTENLPVKIYQLKPGESPVVIGLSESKKIADLVQQAPEASSSSTTEPEAISLPQANRSTQREFISLNPRGEARINIVDDPALLPYKSTTTKPVFLMKYDYDLVLRGYYGTLMDFLNQVITSTPLIDIQKITIKPVTELGLSPLSAEQSIASDTEAVSPATPLEMSLMFSIYFYDPANQAT